MAKVAQGTLINDKTVVGPGGAKTNPVQPRTPEVQSVKATDAAPATQGPRNTATEPYAYSTPVDATLINNYLASNQPSDDTAGAAQSKAGSQGPSQQKAAEPAAAEILNEWGSVEGYNPYAENAPSIPAYSGTPVTLRNSSPASTSTAVSSQTTPASRTGGTDYLEQWYLQYPNYNDQIVQGIKTGYNDMEEQLRAANAAAVEKGILEQQAALENALPYYNQMIAQNARDKLIASDNLALRNAAAGDLGGIGQKMYSDQQNAYDSRLYAIELEQINLQNTINQQIANLRAQGEFELADALLELGQSRMQTLTNQYNTYAANRASWASSVDNYNLSRDNLAYEQAMQRLQLGLFSAADAEALGVDAAAAQAYSDRINLLAQLNIQQAQAELENLYSTIRAREAAASGAGSGDYAPTTSTIVGGNKPAISYPSSGSTNSGSSLGDQYLNDVTNASANTKVMQTDSPNMAKDEYAVSNAARQAYNGATITGIDPRTGEVVTNGLFNSAHQNYVEGAKNYDYVVSQSGGRGTPIPRVSRVYPQFMSSSNTTRDGVLSTNGLAEYYNLYPYYDSENKASIDAVKSQLDLDYMRGVIDSDDRAAIKYLFGIA